eukprot:TRINITY_DN497_c0_g1_i7.p1 TRINITY_DN497_c0_g1~~TRINITY_DN497_c0_g1_i7.p1  ORF type:complete len:244 (-),score=55.50 TRINITY_DN497_c0_g1_i7:207-890(-)
MSSSRAATIAATGACLLLVCAPAFLSPVASQKSLPAAAVARVGRSADEAASSKASSSTSCCLAIGAHAGLALMWALRSKGSMTQRKAAEGAAPVKKYVETPADQRLFEYVYEQYTVEYLKGPLYWNDLKMQGALPYFPGNPIKKNNRLTSNVVGNLKHFSSNELAFLAMLFFGIGLYGNLQFNLYDPQWEKVDAGGYFNVSYIVESFMLPVSFFFHIACYIQRQNGK